jgi:hypothetical protein
MQAQPELAHVYPNRAILGRTVAGGLAEDGLTDLALGQSFNFAQNRILRKVREQGVQVGGFLEGSRAKNAFHEQPTRIGAEILVECDNQVGLISPKLGGLHIGTDYIRMRNEDDSLGKLTVRCASSNDPILNG